MLTARQRDALVFIEERIAFTGRAPTARELADGIGVAHKGQATDQLITALETKGFVTRTGEYARNIRVLKPLRQRIPIYDAATNQIRGWLP